MRDFDAWARANQARMLSFARLMTPDAQLAEDAVQEAFIKALVHWRRISSMESPEAYVRRIIANYLTSWWRRVGRRERVGADATSPLSPELASRLNAHHELWEACLRLPVRQRAAVVLRYYEDLPFDEIAAVLQCDPGTARSHVHRALRKLRTQLTEVEVDHG